MFGIISRGTFTVGDQLFVLPLNVNTLETSGKEPKLHSKRVEKNYTRNTLQASVDFQVPCTLVSISKGQLIGGSFVDQSILTHSLSSAMAGPEPVTLCVRSSRIRR